MKKINGTDIIKDIIAIICVAIAAWIIASVLNVAAHNLDIVEQVASWNFFNCIL